MKILQLREQRKKEYVVSEIRVMRRIHHPNIVNLIDCFLSPDRKELKVTKLTRHQPAPLLITPVITNFKGKGDFYTYSWEMTFHEGL